MFISCTEHAHIELVAQRVSTFLLLETMEKENSEPNCQAEKEPDAKKRHLSLSRTKKRRFADVSGEKLESMSTYSMPKNSALNSKWAINNLTDWVADHNLRHPDSLCPQDLLSPFCSIENLNKWLPVFVTETRNQQGEPYPPKTIYILLCGILREMRTKNPEYPNFMN